MKLKFILSLGIAAAMLIFANLTTAKEGEKMAESVYEFTVKDIDGNDVKLSEYKGKTLIFVNVASKCGFTPQYEGLQALYEKYKDKGLVILGFPCNQFGSQEPGTNEEIKEFCSVNYGVTFPMFDKIDVNGKEAHPLYDYLRSQAKGTLGTEAIKWNFTKFLVDKNGKVIDRKSLCHCVTSPFKKGEK
jgi:glutathione peroxidase